MNSGRSRHCLQTSVRVSIVAVFLPAAGLAQDFPESEWVALPQAGVPLTDAVGDAIGSPDLVGSSVYPVAYVHSDGVFWFFRVRLDEDPGQSGNLMPFAWGVEFESDSDLTDYEFLAVVDGISFPDEVSLKWNTLQAIPGDPADPSEMDLDSYPGATHSRVVSAPSTFNEDPDHFLDWAIPTVDLAVAGVTESTPVRFIFGSSDASTSLNGDLADPGDAGTIESAASDVILCGVLGCSSPTAAPEEGAGSDVEVLGSVVPHPLRG